METLDDRRDWSYLDQRGARIPDQWPHWSNCFFAETELHLIDFVFTYFKFPSYFMIFITFLCILCFYILYIYFCIDIFYILHLIYSMFLYFIYCSCSLNATAELWGLWEWWWWRWWWRRIRWRWWWRRRWRWWWQTLGLHGSRTH